MGNGIEFFTKALVVLMFGALFCVMFGALIDDIRTIKVYKFHSILFIVVDIILILIAVTMISAAFMLPAIV